MAFIDDIKRAYLQGSMLMRLILINIGAFVLLHVLALGSLLTGGQATSLLQWVELPSDLTWLIRRPWTLVTYMFSHYGLLHILFNMLWLYWLGRIFMEFFSPKQLTGLYLLGGWGGALFYLLAFNLLPHFQSTQGFLIGLQRRSSQLWWQLLSIRPTIRSVCCFWARSPSSGWP